MKTENHIGEITFDNLIQLRDTLEEAWNRGKFEQATEDLIKEKKSYLKLAAQLGIKKFNTGIDIEAPLNFQQWFLRIVKKMQMI